MADISDINAAQTVKVVGADSTGVEQTPVQSTSDGELRTSDSLTKAVDGTLSFTAGTPTEIKVGGSRLVGRKVLFFIPAAAGKYGFTAGSQNIPVSKNQPITITITDAQGVWFDFNSGTNNLYVVEGSVVE